ncbi:hypothetical protein AK812_SmicGene4566, partial [Symbiodinium microadriaticum]
EESLGLIRVKVKAEKDEKEGFVTVAGNQGTVYLEPYTAYVAFQKSLEKDLKSLRETTAEVGKYLDNKVGDLQNAKSGPLAETKNSLLKLKPRVAQVQQATLDLKKKIAQAEKKLTAAVEEEKKRRLEAADKRAAAALVEDVAKLLQADEEALNKVLPAAEGLISSLGGDQENPVAAMEAADKEIAAVEESLAATMVKVKEKSEGMKGHQAKGPYSEAKNSLVKMKVKTGALENKCRKLRTGLQVAKNDMAKAAEDAILKALREHVKAQGMSAEELFQKLGKGEESIQADTLRAFIEKIPDSQLKASQLDLALTRFSHGLSKLMVLDLVQEFQKCVKEIALTTALEVKDGKTVRKLAKGEVLEVVEVGRIDPATSLLRMRCRALVDLKEGWVTSQGNAGSSFLEACPKPFLCCGAESPLQEGFPSSSSERKRLQDGDVLEILEGPRKEEPPEVHRMKVKASQDGSTGWVTFKDGAGKEFFKPAKLMALRKLDVGEVLDVVEGPTEDSVRSLSRVKVLAKKDGAEGWVTVKGNQGTSYAEESDKHYICSESVALESKPASGSAETRKLEEGEIIQEQEEEEEPSRPWAPCRKMSLGRLLCLLALAQEIRSRLIKSMEVYWTVPDQPLQLLRCPGWSCAEDMVVSEDGLFLITSNDREVCFWEMPSCTVGYVEAHCEETKMITCRTMPSSASALAMVRDFAMAVAVKNEVYIWQLHTLQLKIATNPRLLTHDADVLLLANDGHQLLTGCANSMLTMFWLYADENAEATVSWRLNVTDDQGDPQRLTALALQRGGTRWLAVGTDPPHSSPTSRLMIWKLSSFSPPSRQPQYTATHISSVLSIAFHPSLPWIYTGTRQGRLTTWHYTSQDGHPMQQRGVDYSVTHLQFSASGGFLLSGGNSGIAELWDGDQQAAATFKYAGSIRGWTFSADEAFVLANSAEEASFVNSVGVQGAADVILAFPLDLRFPRSGFQLGLHRVVGGFLASLWDVRGRMTVPVTEAQTNISLIDLVHFPGTDSVLVGGGNTDQAAATPMVLCPGPRQLPVAYPHAHIPGGKQPYVANAVLNG